jgi:putative nucleotide binding protein
MGFNAGRAQKKFEDFAYVLDFLRSGMMGRGAYRAEPMVQLVGESYFTLLEAVASRNASPALGARIYIGKELSRKEIEHILGRIQYRDLTAISKTELPTILEEIVKKQEGRFVGFFNSTTGITPRMHSLELLPGVGKKFMWNILRAREMKPFTSFQDIKDRTELHDPAKILVKRILEELSEDAKYRIFTRPP